MGDAESADLPAAAEAPEALVVENPNKRQKLAPHLRRDYAIDASDLLGREVV